MALRLLYVDNVILVAGCVLKIKLLDICWCLYVQNLILTLYMRHFWRKKHWRGLRTSVIEFGQLVLSSLLLRETLLSLSEFITTSKAGVWFLVAYFACLATEIGSNFLQMSISKAFLVSCQTPDWRLNSLHAQIALLPIIYHSYTLLINLRLKFKTPNLLLILYLLSCSLSQLKLEPILYEPVSQILLPSFVHFGLGHVRGSSWQTIFYYHFWL